MWVARDKNNVLKLFVCKPTRIDNEWYFDGNSLILFGQNADKFNMLKWEDEPVFVDLIPNSSFNFKLSSEVKNYIEKKFNKSIEELKMSPLNNNNN